MKDNERVLIESDVIWSNPELSFLFSNKAVYVAVYSSLSYTCNCSK